MTTKKSAKGKSVSPKVRNAVTILLFALTLVYPLSGLVGVLVMWFWTTWKKWVKILVTIPFVVVPLFLIISLNVYIYFFRPFQISGEGMWPTYKNKEYLITNVYQQNQTKLDRGDVIVFIPPTDAETNFIKRVIAIPGDVVMIQNGEVYVNNSIQDEGSYLPADVETYTGSFLREGETIQIPQGNYFVLGDNRPFSSDSREWGFVTEDRIISKVLYCYWNCK